MKMYCVKCKGNVDSKKTSNVRFRNGRHAIKGKCPDCGTFLYEITG